jgi:hypothetical protein
MGDLKINGLRENLHRKPWFYAYEIIGRFRFICCQLKQSNEKRTNKRFPIIRICLDILYMI